MAGAQADMGLRCPIAFEPLMMDSSMPSGKKDDIGLSIWQKSLRKIMTERSKCVIIPSLTVEAIKKPAKGWNLNP